MVSFVVVAFVSGIVLVAALGWFREQQAVEEWDRLLSPDGRQAYQRLRGFWQAEVEAADWSFSRAMAQPDASERLRLLGASAEFLVSLVPTRVEQLRTLSLYSRMVSALAPLPPVDYRALRLSGPRRVAMAGSVLHHLLVTVTERFRLRLFILRHGFGAVVRSLFRSRQRAERVGVEAEWWRIVAAREDFRSLDEETMASCRVLVVALGLSEAPAPTGRAGTPAPTTRR